MKQRVKNVSRAILILIVAYLLVYAMDSVTGGYWPWPEAGNHYWGESGLPMHTAFFWQPYLGYADNYNATVLGSFFKPAIYCDRQWVHRTLDLSNTNDEHRIFTTNDLAKPRWHPVGVRIAEKEEQEKAVKVNAMLKNVDLYVQSPEDYSRTWRHAIGALLFNKYGTNAIAILEARKVEMMETNSAYLFIATNRLDQMIEEIHANEVRYAGQLKDFHP